MNFPLQQFSLITVLLCWSAQEAKADRYSDCLGKTNTKIIVDGCTKIIDRGSRETTKNRIEARIRRGVVHLNKRRLKQSIADFDAVIRLDAKHGRAYYLRGRAYVNSGDFDRGLKDFESAIRYRVGRSAVHSIHTIRGRIHSEKGRYRQAIEEFGAALRLGVRKDIYNSRGFAYFKDGQHERAIADFDRILITDPKYRAAIINRKRAAKALRAAGKSVPPPPKPQQTLGSINDPGILKTRISQCASREFIFSRKIIGLNSTKGLDACTDVIKSKIASDTDKAEAFANRGQANRSLNRNQAAVKDLDEAIRLRPGFSKAYRLRGVARQYLEIKKTKRIWSKKERKFIPVVVGDDTLENIRAAAMKDFDTAIRLNDKDPAAFYQRAGLFRSMKQFDRALRDFGGAVRLDDKYKAAYLRRGQLLNEMKRYEQAIRDFDKVIGLSSHRQPDVSEFVSKFYVDEAKKHKEKAKFALLPESVKERIREENRAKSQRTEGKRKDLRSKPDRNQGRLDPRIRHKKYQKRKKVARPKPSDDGPVTEPVIKRPKARNGTKKKSGGVRTGCDSRTPHIAIKACTDKINAGHKTASIFHVRGKAYLRNDEPRKAIADFDLALKKRQSDKSFVHVTQSYRARAYMLLNDAKNAFAAFDAAILARPEIALTYLGRGELYFKTNQYELAIKDYGQALALKPRKATASASHYHRARAFSRTKQFDKALEDYAEAIRLTPQSAVLYHGRGEVYLMALRMPEKALPDFDMALKLSPRHVDALHYRGLTHMRIGNNELAEKDFNAALTIKPDYRSTLRERANLYRLLNKYDASVKDFSHLIRLAPTSWDVYFQRGVVYFQQRQYARAITDFDYVLKKQPKHLNTLINRAVALFRTGQFDRSLNDVNAALAIAPHDKTLQKYKQEVQQILSRRANGKTR